MSDISQIARLLQQAIADRQTLTIGQSNAPVTQGNLGSFSTGTGLISAIATNFCYGDCLLAKVEGKWYAINPADNREVIRSNVDRFIKRKPKTGSLPKISIVAGIKTGSYGGGGES